MQIVLKSIDALTPYDKNARTHSDKQLVKLMDAIKRFGFLVPIEIDNRGQIIAGHARWEAAKRLGLKDVPTIMHEHLSDNERRAYILASNRLALEAGWDHDLLRDELKSLLDDNFETELTGFDSDEISALLATNIVESEDEPVESLRDDVITKLGDVWILGAHRLICGDSSDPLIVNKLIGDRKPTLMVTDPPYGVDYTPEWREGKDLGKGKRSTGKVLNDTRIDWTETYALAPCDVAYIWHSAKYTHEIAQHLINCGFDIINQIVWVKQHFALSRGDYHWQHEPCWYVVKKDKKHNWQGARDQSTVWEIANNNMMGGNDEEKTGHSTQKPLACMERPILNNSAIGDHIYDPFGGSGTTLIVCENLQRKCLMIELSEKYCDLIIRRWEKVSGKNAVLEETGDVFNGDR